MPDGLIIAAPASGAGKTVVTLALLEALSRRGLAVAAFKAGPDYIDPRYHEAAAGTPCFNLDPWAMRPETIARLVAERSAADLMIVEGVMGLFDGPEQGRGSTADLAAALGLPVVLVVDAGRQGQSVAALARGFSDFRHDVEVAGVILNRVASDRHAALLSFALREANVAVLGVVPRSPHLALPDRHLGLVQAGEHADIAGFLAGAAALIERSLDVAALIEAAQPLSILPRATGEGDHAQHGGGGGPLSRLRRQLPRKRGSMRSMVEAAAAADGPTGLPPLGQRMALASDAAFAFAYPHLLSAWRRAGAEIVPFSPLADEPPDPHADAVFLPGGYPELHAGRLAASRRFRDGLLAAARRGALVYGECGGFMVLGEALIDADGRAHAMAGLLPAATSFADRRLALGYRRLRHHAPLPFPPRLRGHEFHYSTLARQGDGDALFEAADAAGRDLGPAGLRRGLVMGSYLHVIDREA